MMCAGFEERIARYVGGDLATEDASAIEQHLRVCSDCASLARELAEDRAWLASRPPEAAEVDFTAMRREIRREIARPRWGWKWIAVAAAVLIVIGISVRRMPVDGRPLPHGRGSERGPGAERGGRGYRSERAAEGSGFAPVGANSSQKERDQGVARGRGRPPHQA